MLDGALSLSESRLAAKHSGYLSVTTTREHEVILPSYEAVGYVLNAFGKTQHLATGYRVREYQRLAIAKSRDQNALVH